MKELHFTYLPRLSREHSGNVCAFAHDNDSLSVTVSISRLSRDDMRGITLCLSLRPVGAARIVQQLRNDPTLCLISDINDAHRIHLDREGADALIHALEAALRAIADHLFGQPEARAAA